MARNKARRVTKKSRLSDEGDSDTYAGKGVNTEHSVYPVNTTGLLSLPVEVFEMIYTELLANSKLITKEEVLANRPWLDRAFEHRSTVLRSLTQVCRALRASCLPRYYEHVEACICHTSRVWYKQLSERLEKTSLMLSESPSLAVHVQYVDYSTFALSIANTSFQNRDCIPDALFYSDSPPGFRRLPYSVAESSYSPYHARTLTNDYCTERCVWICFNSSDTDHHSPLMCSQHTAVLP